MIVAFPGFFSYLFFEYEFLGSMSKHSDSSFVYRLMSLDYG